VDRERDDVTEVNALCVTDHLFDRHQVSAVFGHEGGGPRCGSDGHLGWDAAPAIGEFFGHELDLIAHLLWDRHEIER